MLKKKKSLAIKILPYDPSLWVLRIIEFGEGIPV
jgi:hypothetical protein